MLTNWDHVHYQSQMGNSDGNVTFITTTMYITSGSNENHISITSSS